LASLAKNGKYFAVRQMMRAGKVTTGDLKATCDGKTVVEWVWDGMTKWNFAADLDDESLLAFKLMSEVKYRYVSTFNLFFSFRIGGKIWSFIIFNLVQILERLLQNADVSSLRLPGNVGDFQVGNGGGGGDGRDTELVHVARQLVRLVETLNKSVDAFREAITTFVVTNNSVGDSGLGPPVAKRKK
jgi:hypothetical protein